MTFLFFSKTKVNQLGCSEVYNPSVAIGGSVLNILEREHYPVEGLINPWSSSSSLSSCIFSKYFANATQMLQYEETNPGPLWEDNQICLPIWHHQDSLQDFHVSF